MKKKLLGFSLLAMLGASSLKAQMNVGSTAAPDPSAALQVTSTTKGFLGSKVALTDTLTAAPVTTPATGLWYLTLPTTATLYLGIIFTLVQNGQEWLPPLVTTMTLGT